MTAIILAAGMGRRLGPMGWDKPKCLLPVGGTTLLGNILNALGERGVDGAVIVVGYRRHLVEAEAAKHSVACEFVENADFATTNTIYSLFFARDHLASDILYFNADVWFEPKALDLLLAKGADGQAGADALLLVDEHRCGDEEVKVVVDASGRVTRIGKRLDPSDCAGEFIGVGRFNASMGAAFADALEWRCSKPTGRSAYFEAALDDVLEQCHVRMVSLGDIQAVEIDTPEDFESAKELSGQLS